MTSPTNNYQSFTVKAQAWDFIEKRYQEDWGDKHQGLIELVRHIRNSGLALRLFGSTSMDKLVISIYDPLDYYKEALHIRFDLDIRKWQFEYFAIPYQAPEFVRTYDEELGIKKLDKFISSISW